MRVHRKVGTADNFMARMRWESIGESANDMPPIFESAKQSLYLPISQCSSYCKPGQSWALSLTCCVGIGFQHDPAFAYLLDFVGRPMFGKL